MEAFQLRLWDGRIGRWLNPDPYGQHSSPYLGMGNSPVNTIDPDGGWETRFGAWWHGLWDGRDGKVFQSESMGDWGISYNGEGFDPGDGGVGINGSYTFGGKRYNNSGYTSIPSKSNFSQNLNTNTIPCIQCHNEFPSYAGSPFDGFQAETQLGQGIQTTGYGVVGAVGSAYAIGQSGGTLAAAGGATAFTMSMAEIGIGIAQIGNSFKTNPTSQDLQVYKANTALGHIALAQKFNHPVYWDAVGGFLPGIFSGGNLKTLIHAPGIIKAESTGKLMWESVEAYDAWLDTYGLYEAAKN